MPMLKTHDDTAIEDTMEDAIGVVIEEALLVPKTAAMLQGCKILKCVWNVFETLNVFETNIK